MSQTRSYLVGKVHFVYHASSNIHIRNKQAALKLQELTGQNEPIIHFDQQISTNAEMRLYCELADAAGDYSLHVGAPYAGRALAGAEGMIKASKKAWFHAMLLVRASFLNRLLEEEEVEKNSDFLTQLFCEYNEAVLKAERSNGDYHIHRYSTLPRVTTSYLTADSKPKEGAQYHILNEQFYVFSHVRAVPEDGLFVQPNPPIIIYPIVDVVFHNYTLHYFTTKNGKKNCQSMLELLAEKIEESERLHEIHSVLAIKHSQPLLPLIKAKCLTRTLLATQQDTLSEDEKTFCDFLMSFVRNDTPASEVKRNGVSIPLSLSEVKKAMKEYFTSKYAVLKDINQQARSSVTPC